MTTTAEDQVDSLLDQAFDAFEAFQSSPNIDLTEFTKEDCYIQGFVESATQALVTQSEAVSNLMTDEDNAMTVDSTYDILDQIGNEVPPNAVDNSGIGLPVRTVLDIIKLLHDLLEVNGVDISGYKDFHELMSKTRTPFRTTSKANN